jgi:Na+/proline symporter
MSTSDSSILAGASVVTENIIPLFKKDLSEKAKLRWTRIMVLVIGLCSLLIALFAQTIYKLSVFAWTVILVGIFAPFAFGMYWKRANQTGALAAFLGGWITWLITLPIFYPTTLEINAGDTELAIWDATYIGSVPAFLVSVLLLIGVSLLTQKRDAPKPMLSADNQVLDYKNRLGITKLWDALRKLRPGEIDE